MCAPAKHTRIPERGSEREGERKNAHLLTCKQINEHANRLWERQVELQSRWSHHQSAQHHCSSSVCLCMHTALCACVLRRVVNMRVYVALNVRACMLCHFLSISSGLRVISVLNRAPSAYASPPFISSHLLSSSLLGSSQGRKVL